MSAALEGGRLPAEENLSARFGREAPVSLDRPAALRIGYRIDLEIQVPPPPSGFLPEIGSQAIEAIASVLEGIPAFADVLPTFEERATAEKERFIDEQAEIADLSTAVIQAIVALEWEYTRNPPSVADLLEVTIPSRHLPVDLRVFDNIRIQGWPFVRNAASESFEERLDRCVVGDPGHFAGIVDNVEINRRLGTQTLSCRDLTAIPLGREVSAALLEKMDLDRDLDDIIEDIMERGVPGGDMWRVEARGKLRVANRNPVRLLSDEKSKRVFSKRKGGKSLVNSGVSGFVGAVLEPEEEDQTDSGSFLVGKGVSRLQPPPPPALLASKKKVEAPRKPKAEINEFDKRKYTKIVTFRVPPTTETIFGSQKLTVWDAITKLCSKLGAIPEVSLAEDGSPLIVVVDAEDYLDGRHFRHFSRFDQQLGKERNHRIVTYGHDIAELAESRDLTAGDRVDWVEVVAVDPDRGLTRRERFGKPGARAEGSGIQIPHHGVTKRSHLKRLARQAWEILNKGELQLAVELDVPWTTGGGVDDPDLLQCAAGTIIEVAFAAAKRYRGNALEDILTGSPIFMPAQPARVLGRASERVEPSLVFQVAELVHSGSGEGDGAYRCALTLQTLLDDGLSPDELDVEDT